MSATLTEEVVQPPVTSRKPVPPMQEQEGGLARFGLALAKWSERWFPDPLVFALAGIIVVFVLGLFLHQSPAKMAVQGGKNFWTLVPFTMQMVMIIIGGYVVASTPLVNRLIKRLAEVPKTPRGAIAMVALFSMLTSLISWGLSLIFSGLFVRELSRRVKGMDYRAAGAAAYLGLGAVWALGLSSSAAMMMATKGAIPPSLLNISGLIPLTRTLFLWQSIVTAAVLIVVSVLVAYLSAPSAERARTAESYGIKYEAAAEKLEAKTKPGEWLEYSPLLTILVVVLLGWYLVDVFRTSPQGALAALALASQAICACRGRLRSRHRRSADPISVLRSHLRHYCRHRHLRLPRKAVRLPQYSQYLSTARGCLFGYLGRVCPIRRQQVGN